MSHPAKTEPFDYSLSGLRIRSDLELPELLAGDASSDPDVIIRVGENGAAGGETLEIDGIARFQVTGGREIRVFPEPGAPERNIRLYLLGSAMGMLLHQRGLLPLHASAVEIDGRVVAFMGPSGSGKSTLAAWFHDRGYRIIADDVCVVHFDEGGRPLVSPGLPRLRLWKDALAATGRQEAQFERSYAGDDAYEKYDVPMAAGTGGGTLELAGLYLLDRGDELAIDDLQGVEAADAVFANTYRGGFVAGAGKVRAHWEACLRLIGQVPIFSLARSWGHDRLGDQIGQLAAHVRTSIVRPRG